MWSSHKYSKFCSFVEESRFDAVVDHLAIAHIMKSKAEPASNRIKRLLEILSVYSFNLYYIKGKDMVLSDFLSRQHGDSSNLHEIIPISFNMGRYCNRTIKIMPKHIWYKLGPKAKQTMQDHQMHIHHYKQKQQGR